MSLLAVAGTMAQAQTVNPATKAAYDAAFQETLRKPADPPTLIRFAELAIEMGDLEGAISALERLLLQNPDQPRVKLELAALYNRLGSREAARPYAEAVVAAGNATPENKEQARALLAEIDASQTRSVFSGDLFVGLQFSSNANSGPSGLIKSAGASTVPTPGVSGTADWAAVAGGTLQHRYDLNDRNDDVFETTLAAYATRQFAVSAANVLLIDLNTGPRFGILEGTVDGLTARPFFTGRYLAVHDLPTYWSYGTGFEVAKAVTPDTRAALTIQGRRRDFVNNVDAPTNTNSSGNQVDAGFELRSDVTSWLTLTAAASSARYVATVASESYWEQGGGISAAFRFTDPLGINGREWRVSLGGTITFGNYDAPDANVDPNVTRTQRDLAANLIAAVPLDDQVSLVGQVTYTDRSASISNYAYNAVTALMGLGLRF